MILDRIHIVFTHHPRVNSCLRETKRKEQKKNETNILNPYNNDTFTQRKH